MWISLWEQTYARVGRRPRDAARPGLAGAQLWQRGQDARATASRACSSGLFTSPQWSRDHERQAPYLLAAGTWSKGRRHAVYFQTFAEMSKATFAAAEPGNPDFVRPFAGYLGPEARLLLLICEKLGDAGARRALKALMADVFENVSMQDDLNKRSGWAIAFENPN